MKEEESDTAKPPSSGLSNLIEEILRHLSRGIFLDVRMERYWKASLPEMTIGDLADRMEGEPDQETATLIGLLFFPDDFLQLRLEPLLEKASFTGRDEEEIIRRLTAGPPRTPLIEPGGIMSRPIQMPESAISPFVQGLRITRRIPSSLSQALAEAFEPETACRLKVLLRNSRIDFPPAVVDFLNSFFAGLSPETMDAEECTGEVLALLDEGSGDPYVMLAAKKERLLRARAAAKRFETLLKQSNMETLMAQGIRAPETGVEEAESRLARIDKIFAALGPAVSRQASRIEIPFPFPVK